MENNNILYIYGIQTRGLFNMCSIRVQIKLPTVFLRVLEPKLSPQVFLGSDLNSRVQSLGDENSIQELWRDH